MIYLFLINSFELFFEIKP